MAIATAPTAPAATANRIDETDADYTRLHAATVRRLSSSIQAYVRELRRCAGDTNRAHAAASRFVQRHTRLLREALVAGWREGQRDYYASCSVSPGTAPHAPPTDEQIGRRLAFYAPSVAKMAAEGLRAMQEGTTGTPTTTATLDEVIRLDNPYPRGPHGHWGEGGMHGKHPPSESGKRAAKAETAKEAGTGGGGGSRGTGRTGGHAPKPRNPQAGAKAKAKAPPTKEQIAAKAKAAEEKLAAKTQKAAEAKVARTAAKVTAAETKVKEARKWYSYHADKVDKATDALLGGSLGASERLRSAQSNFKYAKSDLAAAQRGYSRAVEAHRAAAEAAGVRVNADRRAGNHFDDNGQATPFSRGEFVHATITAKPTGEGMNAAESGMATLGRKQYYIKHLGETLPTGEKVPPAEQARSELAALRVATAAGMKDAVPAAAYHIEYNGEHYIASEITAEKALGDRGMGRMSVAQTKAFDATMHGESGSRHALLDYVMGRRDAHEENYRFDRQTGHLVHIDQSLSFTHGAQMHWSPALESIHRSAGNDMQKSHLSHTAIEHFVRHADAIQRAARESGLTKAQQDGVTARLGVLRTMAKIKNPTISDLMDTSVHAMHAAGEIGD